jgi:hypothetical protein
VQLAQVGLDPRRRPGGVDQRLRRLPRAAQRRHVDGVEAGVAGPASHRLRLCALERRQRRAALSVLAPRLGVLGIRGDDLSVPDEEHVGGGVAVLGGHRVILLRSPARCRPVPPAAVARRRHQAADRAVTGR